MPRGVYPRNKKIKSPPKGIIMYLFHNIPKKELVSILLLGISILAEKD